MVDISSLGRSNRQSRDTFSTHDAGFVVAPDTSSLTHLREQTQIQWLTRSFNNRAASDPQGFGQALELALGSRADRSTINSLIDSAIAGDLPLPNTRFVDEKSLGNGALGAYDPRNGGTILLDRSLLTDDAAMERVFLEEAGHHLDAQAGAGDATGDEGAIFARSLLGESLTGTQMNSLRAENDHGTVQLDGQLVEVEFNFGSDTPGGSVDGIGGKETNTGSSSNDSYSDNDHSNETFRPKPPAQSPAPVQTGGYDEVGINVPAPAPTPAPTDVPHGYDEVGIDVPASLAYPGQKPNGSPAGGPTGDATTGSSWISNVGHFFLDVVGLVPVVGEWADALNATWYAAEGRFFEASLSAAGTVPFVGIGATIGKWFGVTRTLARTEDLATAAELGAQTLASIDRLRAHGFGELADAAVDSLGSIGRMNVETVARLDDLLTDPALQISPILRRDLEKAQINLAEHLKDKDLSGALQEVMGIPIPGHDHIQEVADGLKGLNNARDSVDKALAHAQYNNLTAPEVARLQSTGEALDGMILSVTSLLNTGK